MMSNKSCVPGCCDSAKTKFGISKNVHVIWKKVKGFSLNRHSKVCEKHFKPSDIVSTRDSGEGNNQISIGLRKLRLKPGAVLVTFLNKDDTIIEQFHANRPDHLGCYRAYSIGKANARKPLDWNKYLALRNLEEVPEDLFSHVCKSEQNGIDLGSIVEIENEDQNGYWFASVCLSRGVLINLHYIGDKNDEHDFWIELNSSRIHPLNWGNENNKKLLPPCPDRFLQINLENVKKKIQYCENVVPNSVLQMKGAPIYNIFKPGMFLEVQDKEYPYGVWISKILKNKGGRLFVKMLGVSPPEETPFWLFYSNERIFPIGWADQKGLPWRVMNVDINIEESIDSNLLINVLKPKFPEQHCYKVGDKLEAINPYSLMVFYIATIVKVYDNHYFKVELDNDSDTKKRITFVATKENPYLFNAGWANKHKFLLKPPSDWDSSKKFSWINYVMIKHAKLAQIDNACKKNIHNIHTGMTLEAVDPVNPDHIRVATIKGFADHWIFLSFDRTNWNQELLHVRSIYSDDIFPIGWCNKHKYLLSTPKLPFTDCNSYENHYYGSDIDTDFNESHTEFLTKYPNYFKGDIPYHYSEMDNQTFEDNFEESLLNELIESGIMHSDSKTENNDVTEPIINDKKVVTKKKNQDQAEKQVTEGKKQGQAKKKVTEEKKQSQAKKKVDLTKRKKVKEQTTTLNRNYYEMSIYFNKNCSNQNHFVKSKLAKIPNVIGPGPVSKILSEALAIFIRINYVPFSVLKNIKKKQRKLFDGPGGVSMVITAPNKTSNPLTFKEELVLPESKKMAQVYCSTLCRLFGVCEYFMTTEKTVCTRCVVNKTKKLKFETNAVQKIVKPMKRNNETDISTSSKKYGNELIYEEIAKVAAEELDWSNQHIVDKYKYYMGCIINFEKYARSLEESLSQHELALLIEIEAKKVYLKDMDDDEAYSHTKVDYDEENIFPFIKDWKTSFENFYRKSPYYKNYTIDIGDFEHIQVTSNPKYWSPDDVYKYLSNDVYCEIIRKELKSGLVDGVAFMLLNEEQLVFRLKYTINLAIRVMCHVAYVKHIFLTKYTDHH
ncbi:SLED domain,Zinc finger, C2CH-type,Sterile alpha motif/pointed domain,Mbt repeat [Cinara cedri]|uniref:SLED domain,Zinc finger, C2CH-type,Sterile alpha motif/pointed domain,Mbt repeat n=1 Tax=Cinara cedri TaxID=506608 RepID=A0A5E4MKA2_9HEMI|nr:SLED domain,Zinc finger, C2CH-type,Sterile alpha motif/pointed domain,Mbt repeat [Cinara cedri]